MLMAEALLSRYACDRVARLAAGRFYDQRSLILRTVGIADINGDRPGVIQ